MSTTVTGIPQHGEIEGAQPPTPRAEIDRAVEQLAAQKDRWARLPVRDRRAILRELGRDFARVAEPWAEACREAEGIPAGTSTAAEEWLAGPYFIQRNLALLDDALADVERYGRPRIPGPVTTRPDGRVVAQVFPQRIYDRIFYGGVSAEVWMEPGVAAGELPATQAVAYHQRDPRGRISLVLGAGNVSSIGPMDALYKLFVENRVVVYKLHPLNAYLGPLLAEGFQALLDWGVLRLVYGGADVGSYLCEHPLVDEIHITGSDKTVEAIVFGPGEEGRLRKAQRKPKNDKPISAELGNVSPVIVAPGPWTEADLAYQAENLAAMLTNNAGFNCNATRVLITSKGWTKRRGLLDRLRAELARIPTRRAYYPGAEERFRTFLEAHPEAERFGRPADGELPWAMIPDLDPQAEGEICYRTEAFCGLFAETALEAPTVKDFLARAVDFANRRLWGTLNATILIHPKSLKNPENAEALDRAIAELRYGTVSINNWAAIGYGLVVPPWGAYPGHDVYDVQSGIGVVHNTLMFSRVEKTVVRSPWRMSPKPIWFPSHKTALAMARKLVAFEASPSPWKLPGIILTALRG
ncbi:MAG: aldehyde dehydrogenase family protein [Acidobacteria bacterium]|nr:MAG: aldehyde dehydrogenase family protein [Acidobacteriota bacterium]